MGEHERIATYVCTRRKRTCNRKGRCRVLTRLGHCRIAAIATRKATICDGHHSRDYICSAATHPSANSTSKENYYEVSIPPNDHVNRASQCQTISLFSYRGFCLVHCTHIRNEQLRSGLHMRTMHSFCYQYLH